MSNHGRAQDDAWATATSELVRRDASFEDHWDTYQAIFADRAPSDGPPQAWRPSQSVIAHANLTDLMADVGISTPEALHDWSVAHRDEFWQRSLDRLGILYTRSPTRVLDGPPQQPTWLAGAILNAASTCFRASPTRTAIISGGEGQPCEEITYGQLKSLVDGVSHGLKRLGLATGDAVALYMPMNVECVAAYLGIVQAGMAVISIPDSFAPAEVATRLRLGGGKYIITVDHFLRNGKPVPMRAKAAEAADLVAAELGPETQPIGLIVIGEDTPATPRDKPDIAWTAFLHNAGLFGPVALAPDAVSNILFSSGTTGEPKAIPWTHLTPFKAAVDGLWHQDIHRDDVVAWPTNIGWMMGPWLIYATFMNRACMALYEGVPTSPEFLRFMQDAKVTVFGVVPAIVRAWRESGQVAPGALPSVRIFSSTGEASNSYDYLYLMSLANYQAPVIEYCGGTEIGGGHLTGTVLQPASPATFTTPAMGLDFVLMREDGVVAGPGMGEMYLVPPSIGLSQRLLHRDHDAEYYADCPAGPGGVTLRRHGDEVERLPQGFYLAQGRADDTMNLGGIKVSSIELERVMNKDLHVFETAAVGIAPASGGAQQLVVFVVPAPGLPSVDQAGLKAALQARIKSELNPLFRIHELVVVETLPRTASNKVMRRSLRSEFEALRTATV